jgi:hypothetical protein
MAKKKRKRRRSISEKILIVLGILITLSMLFALVAGLGSGGRGNEQAPLPIDHFEYLEAEGLNHSGGAIPESGSGASRMPRVPPG